MKGEVIVLFCCSIQTEVKIKVNGRHMDLVIQKQIVISWKLCMIDM